MRNGINSLMFIGRVYNSMRNGTNPLIFIGRAYNSMRNGTYPLIFIGRAYNSMRNGTNPLIFISRAYNSMRNGTYPLMFIGRVYNKVQLNKMIDTRIRAVISYGFHFLLHFALCKQDLFVVHGILVCTSTGLDLFFLYWKWDSKKRHRFKRTTEDCDHYYMCTRKSWIIF